MDRPVIKEPGTCTKLKRLLKARALNITVAVVIVICILLYMRSEPEEHLQVIPDEDVHSDAIKNFLPPKESRLENTLEDKSNVQRKMPPRGRPRKDLTTSSNIMTTTPYFTTVPPRIHLKSDKEKQAVHIDKLKVGGFDVGKLELDFLNNYRNPCFFEEREVTNVIHVGTTYKDNAYRDIEGFRDRFKYLRKMVIHSHDELCASSAGCRLRCLPYFMVIGVAEAETVEFFDTLSLHPQIAVPVRQQLDFWHKYRFQEANLNHYLDLFDNATTRIHQQNYTDMNTHQHLYLSVTGEATSLALLTDPYWRKHPLNQHLPQPKYQLIHDLHHVLPRLKLVFLLREPVTHIYWHYNNAPYGVDGKSPEDFHRRVTNSMNWWNTCTRDKNQPERACLYGTPPGMEEFEDRGEDSWWPKTSEFLATLRDGLYYLYVADLLTLYSRDSVLFVRTDDYLSDPRRVLNQQVFPFLDLTPFTGSFRASNDARELDSKASHTQFKPMLPQTKAILTEFYRPYNEKLATLLHDDKFLWKDITSHNYKPNTKCC